MIKFNNISKSIGDKKILDQISFSIPKGKCVGIVGRSGSGKTTLARMMVGLEWPDTGDISVDGEVVSLQNLLEIRKKISFVFQGFNLFNHLTVFENITYAPIHIMKMEAEKAHTKAVDLLYRFKLNNVMHNFPAKLSGGEKQRVALIRAIMINPEVIILDEPTSALDPSMIKEVLDMMYLLKQTGTTMVVVSHQFGFITKICDEIIFIGEGKLIAKDVPQKILSLPMEEIKEYLAAVQNVQYLV